MIRSEIQVERDFIVGVVNFFTNDSELSTISGSIISSSNKQLFIKGLKDFFELTYEGQYLIQLFGWANTRFDVMS